MPRFAANLSMLFTELPFPQRFAAAAQAGFKAVEFLFPYDHAPEEVAGWLKESQLENVLFNLPPGDWAAGERGIASLPGREEEFRASVQTALRYAKALGTPRLHVMAGLVPKGAERAERLALYEANLKHAAEALAGAGLTLLMEPINTRDMPGYLLNTQAEAHAIRERIGMRSLKVQMDLYHAQIMEGDLSTMIQRYVEHVGHVQIAGVPLRHEPHEGELNLAHLMDALEAAGYDGWIGCEYRPKAGTVPGLAWMQRYMLTPAQSN